MARFPRHSVPASLWRIPAGPVAEVSCRTIATAPAWMRGAILPCAPQATLQPNHTLPLFLAGVSESDTPCIPGKSSWGKNLARRGACGLAPLRPNFFCRGEGCKETPRTRTRPARAPKRSAGHRCQRARKAPRFCCISAIVLRLWQEWQRLWRLLRSVNTAQSPRCGWMWSTSVAGVRSPRRAHSRQKGSRRSCPGRRSSVHSGVRYIQCQDLAASLRLSLGRWRSQ